MYSKLYLQLTIPNIKTNSKNKASNYKSLKCQHAFM